MSSIAAGLDLLECDSGATNREDGLGCRSRPVQSATPQVSIHVDAGGGRAVSQFLTGECIEDVNHEIYGGIYSQMLFGESFQEPTTSEPVKGFAAIDGQWSVSDGALFRSDGARSKGPQHHSSVLRWPNRC